QDAPRIQGIRPITKKIHEKVSKMTDYSIYFIAQDEFSDRQRRELCALDRDGPQFHKYQTEYKVHCWVPPITVLPPQDTSIEGLIWD
ncbi:hypothetical protein CMI37_05735, partial [Candidatus Pacearchaeota archaeon]|nr:hypothetical protein [Candidatus Pacearchaeota archaeon]